MFGKSKRKVFCVGLNKTGTTSLKVAFESLGYRVGSETEAKYLLKPWSLRDFAPIINFCRTADAFQDSPFSLPFTFQALDQAFPNSQFILTVRDSEEQWYESLIRFHSKLSGHGRLPTKEDLQAAVNVYRGRPWEGNRLIFDTPESEPYKKDALIAFYRRHNESVIDYFRHRPGKLLVLNVSERSAYRQLTEFLGLPVVDEAFPWENKT